MDNKILIEEINRINELTNSRAIFTENEPFVLTEQVKQVARYVDDIFKVGKTMGAAKMTVKQAKNIKLPKSWSIFGDLAKLNVAGGAKAAQHGTKIKTYLTHGIKTGAKMDGTLKNIIGATDDVGGAIAKNLNNPEMKAFLASNTPVSNQIRQNIAYSLNKSSKLKGAKTGTEQFVKQMDNVAPGAGAGTSKAAGTSKVVKNTSGVTLKTIASTTGKVATKTLTGIKSLWGASKRALKWAFALKWTGKAMLLFGLWAGYSYVMSLFENGDDEMGILEKMKAAFSSGLATASKGTDIRVSEAKGEEFAKQVMKDHSDLLIIIPANCTTLQDISMISKYYAAANNDTELFDVLSSYKDTDPDKAPGLGGLYGVLEDEIREFPILSVAGVLCYTPNQVKAAYDKAGLDMDATPGVIEGLEQDWSSYSCVLKMHKEYGGSVGHAGEREYVKITIDGRNAFFLPDGTCQLEDPENPKVNFKGSYTCAGEEVEVDVTGFNESKKLSDILKESRIITEEEDGETVYFGDVTITIGGQPPSTDDASENEYDDSNGNVLSTTTTTPTSSGVNYVITTVSLADVVAGKGILKKGDMGDSVRAIQTAVDTKDDSKFGPNTEEAVRVYQKRNGLTVTGTITQETAKRIVGSTDVDQGKVNANVVTKTKVIPVTTTDANEMDKIVTQLDNTEKVYIEDQISDLETQVSRAPTKQACKTLIASAKAGIKKGVYLKDLSSLKQCYNSYNFYAWGDGSKKVRKHYGLQGKGNI